MKNGNYVVVEPILARGVEPSTDLVDLIESGIAKLVELGETVSKVSVMVKEGGKLILKVFEVSNEWLPQVVDEAAEFWDEVVTLFRNLPEEIVDKDGAVYKLTEQPSRGAGEDRVLYLWIDEEDFAAPFMEAKKFFDVKAKTMWKAKKQLKRELEQQNYI